jgi:predicted extracellular nuclease
MGAPDLIGLQEIQDNNGATSNRVVDASLTYGELITAIQAAGGPVYSFRDIAPVNNKDGGEPGGNIRVGFLFRTDRGLSFVDRPGGSATNATAAISGPGGSQLTFSPGRIDPNNTAFFDSRKPLAGEFLFNGMKFFAIVNHFNSKSGDTPLFGFIQPPVLYSEVQRIQQAQVVNNFIDSLLALDPQAKIVIMGDLNDFQFSAPLQTLTGGVLLKPIDSLPLAEQYTYLFDGNSQVLDHILISSSLNALPWSFDIVHANAEFPAAERYTDHDPAVFKVCMDLSCP